MSLRSTLAALAGALALAAAPPLHASGLPEECRADARQDEALTQFDRELRRALAERSVEQLALLVHLPLRVNKAGAVHVVDAAALASRFEELFPADLRAALAKSTLADLACLPAGNFYLGGRLWFESFDEDGAARYRVTVLNLGKDDEPAPQLELACATSGHRILVDQAGEDVRYRSWNWPRSATEKPDLELKGSRTHEGTGPCGHRLWTFQSGDVSYTLMENGCGEEDPPAGALAQLEVKKGEKVLSTRWCFG